MIDIEDRNYQPSAQEIGQYIENPLFEELCGHMDSEYGALRAIVYSGDKALLGWNMKFKKAGRTLCAIYPRRGHFPMLVVVGRKEKERVERLLPSLCEAFRRIYRDTPEGMGQRWMLMDFSARTPLFEDALKIIRLRRESTQRGFYPASE